MSLDPRSPALSQPHDRRTHAARLRRAAFVALLPLALAASCRSGPAPLPEGQHIGEPIATRAVLPLAVVDAEPAKYFEQTLLVEATITNVCVKKGCWMQVEDQGHTAMVRWESGCGGQYKFPLEAIGQRVLIQGSFYPKEISEADAAHLESESGGKPIPRQGYEINASGVVVLAR
ncbi:MAG: DUF4920 domain-containing protein [Planctomycetes bacterium]|nr:DUF4920 domain-containing protein [Planctomycetota bacterium]